MVLRKNGLFALDHIFTLSMRGLALRTVVLLPSGMASEPSPPFLA